MILITDGHVTKDLELKEGKNGVKYINFNLAVNSGFGETARTDFLSCSLFNGAAENMIKAKVKKGSYLFVTGEFSVDTYDKKDGGVGISQKLKIAEWHYLSTPKPKEDQQGNGGQSANDANVGGFAGDYSTDNLDDEDLPF